MIPHLSRIFYKDYIEPAYVDKDKFFAFTVSNLGQEFVLDYLQETLPDTDFPNFSIIMGIL